MNTTDLQEFSFSFASLFASQRPVPTHAFTELPTVSQATPEALELRLESSESLVRGPYLPSKIRAYWLILVPR